MSKLRFGLVGYGAWGKHHARAIQETEGAELRAISAASEASLGAAKQDTGLDVHADYRELFARPDIDVVDIVVPNYLHEEVACAALNAGKHVLLEKPMATSIAACDRIIETAQRNARTLLIGHEMRFSGMYGRIRELIDEGVVGQPRYVLVDLWRRPYRSGSGGWRLDKQRVGNWTLEEPVHFFDVACWYLEASGQPSAVMAYANQTDPSAEFDSDRADNFTATVSYADRAYAVVSQSLAAVEHHLSLKVFGTKGIIRAEWHAELDRTEKPSYSLEVSENGSMRPREVTSTPGEFFELRQEMAAMVRSIRYGAPLPITPHEARRAVALCLKAQESLSAGRPVAV